MNLNECTSITFADGDVSKWVCQNDEIMWQNEAITPLDSNAWWGEGGIQYPAYSCISGLVVEGVTGNWAPLFNGEWRKTCKEDGTPVSVALTIEETGADIIDLYFYRNLGGGNNYYIQGNGYDGGYYNAYSSSGQPYDPATGHQFYTDLHPDSVFSNKTTTTFHYKESHEVWNPETQTYDEVIDAEGTATCRYYGG